ncbi:50S ribosomal protein L10 [Candidatus Roizmanbacteria bacterium]|nr:50S ribosomal protein L10 [Candidatus Roizmanbacteria bacterium]
MVNQKKLQYVETLSQILRERPNFALVDFADTPHSLLENLRKELKKNNARFRVIKNTLFERAVNTLSLQHKGLNKLKEKLFPLKERSAMLSFDEDYNKGLGAFFKFAKTTGTLSFKFGVLEDKIYLREELETIAQLPSKEHLVAQVAGSLEAPLYNLVWDMQFTIINLVFVLDQRAKQTND